MFDKRYSLSHLLLEQDRDKLKFVRLYKLHHNLQVICAPKFLFGRIIHLQMTKQEIIQMVERNIRNHPNPMIDTETGVAAVLRVAELAKSRGIDWALVGGIAMHFYGSPRLTKEVDVIASAVLPMEAEKRLNFGGARYRIRVGKKKIPLDWIVRNDTVDVFYEKALAEAYRLPSGLPIVTPEWLIILKYIAGRFRDEQDAVFLLKQKGLADRKLIRRKVTETIGRAGWGAFAAGLQRWYDLADERITTEKDDYEAKRL